MFARIWLIAALLSLVAGGSHAQTTHYVAPIGASVSATPDGTQSAPWGSIGQAISSGKVVGGDVLLLQDGEHGSLHLYNKQFDPPLTIRSENGQNAHFDWVRFYDFTRGFNLESVSIWPVNSFPPNNVGVYSQSTASNIAVKDSLILGTADGLSFMTWGETKWQSGLTSGVNLRSSNTTVSGNTIVGVSFGITTSGSDTVVSDNVIDGFAGDGLRGLGDRSTFTRNKVSNCVKINANHDDGFQSWQIDGAVDDLVIDANIILEWTGPADHPLRCTLQGIGLFDGYYDNLTITNNIVSVSAWHGISVYGGRGVNIRNNTVVNAYGNPDSRPWLRINDHKNGTPSTDVLVANNLSMVLNGTSKSTANTQYVDNAIIFYPALSFKDVLNFDYTPTADSGFVDNAAPAFAPEFDAFGGPRPYGAGPDMGAVEAGAQPASPGDTTTDTSGTTTTPTGTTEDATQSDGSLPDTETVADVLTTNTTGSSGTEETTDIRRVGRWLKAPKGLSKK